MIEVYLHAANALILCSFLVRDIFWLRVVSIIASIVFCTYFLLHEPKLITATIWNMVFVSVNVVQLVVEWRARAKIPLSSEGTFIHKIVFKGLAPRDVQDLVKRASRHEIEKGNPLFNKNNQSDTLTLIVSGQVKPKNQAVMAPGTLIGIRGFLTNRFETIEAQATENTLCLIWPHQAIRDWADANKERHSELMQTMSLALAQEHNQSNVA